MAALFFDVDGTLLDSYNDNRVIAPAVRSELTRVQSLGHKIFLSSGRSRKLITPELLEPGFDGLVLINGGVVEMGGVPIYEERMGYDLALATVDFLLDNGYEYQIVAANDIYTLRSHAKLRSFFDDIGHEDFFIYDYNLDEILQTAIKVESLVPRDEQDDLAAKAKERFGSDIACDNHGGEGTFELYPTAISKAKGIEIALNHLGLSAKDAYAFGDGTNDLEMVEYCGCGVAMGNAQDVVKEAADLICPPVWEDGLAQILAELF